MNSRLAEQPRSKRVLDLSAAIVGLCILSPLLILIAISIRITMGSPVLFRQVRPGRGGVPFRIYKFRTMRVKIPGDRESDGQRLTRLGQLLRSTSLDEMPELWNVLRGQMSLVGPRPLLVEYLPLYTPEQARRHEAKPGITGLAQVSGRNALDWEERFKLDVWYVEHWTFGLDLAILRRTLTKVLKMEGISAVGQATMVPFKGSAGENAGETSYST